MGLRSQPAVMYLHRICAVALANFSAHCSLFSQKISKFILLNSSDPVDLPTIKLKEIRFFLFSQNRLQDTFTNFLINKLLFCVVG